MVTQSKGGASQALRGMNSAISAADKKIIDLDSGAWEKKHFLHLLLPLYVDG